MSVLKIFMPTLVRALTNKRKYIEKNFDSFCCWGHAPEVVLGVLGAKNFSMGICDGAPSTVYSSVIFHCSSDIIVKFVSHTVRFFTKALQRR